MSKQDYPTKLTRLRLSETRDYIKKRYKINVTEARLRCWVRRGLISYSGQRIYLRAERSWCWITCQVWVDAFVSKLQEPRRGQTASETKTKGIDKLFNLKKAQRYIQREYQLAVTIPILRDWCKKGKVSFRGRRFILGAKKRSGLYIGWFTTVEQINEFICELDT